MQQSVKGPKCKAILVIEVIDSLLSIVGVWEKILVFDFFFKLCIRECNMIYMFTTTIKSAKSLEVSEDLCNKTYLIVVEEILL